MLEPKATTLEGEVLQSRLQRCVSGVLCPLQFECIPRSIVASIATLAFNKGVGGMGEAI